MTHMVKLCALFFAALCVTSCTGATEPTGADARSEGAAVQVESPRLVTLGGGATEVVFALGHGDDVVAADASSTYPPEVSGRASLGYYRRVQAEGIIAQRPTLVIASEGSGPPASLAQIEQLGVRVVEVPGVESFPEAKARITFLAELLGEEERGRALVAAIEGEVAEVEAGLAGKPRPRVLFIYARGGGTMLVAGRGTAAEAFLSLAGAQLAAPEHEGFRPLTAEAVVGARPDVILLSEGGLQSMGGVEGVLLAPGIAATPAGAAKRIIAMDDLLLLGFGPRLGEAVKSLAAELHPEAFP